jgi:E1A/CREB-binding protein
MEGTFEGGWQSNADLPERREVIFSIVKLIDQTQPPDSDNAFKRLPQMAKRIEEHLYRTAKSKEEYLDLRTLKKRLQNVAKDLDLSRSSSAGQPPKIASQVRSMQSDARLSVADKGITVTQQHLQQMQQLQELQQRGISDQQRSLLQIQPRGEHSLVASLPPVGQTHDSSQLNTIHTGILKATSKYQDPALDRRRKVIKQQQQRLLLLRHASKCKAGASCKTKYCGQMVALWKHMKKCRNKSCKTSHCLSSRCVLNHYRMCKSENRTMTCEVCAPVMHQIKALKSSTESKNSPKDESPSSLIVRSVPGEFSSTDSMDSNNIRNLAEIEFTQSKLREQQKLLKQLKEQQAQILEQQNQIRQQQRRTQPQSEEEIQLEQQQGLLQQLNQVFEQQQSLLEREVTENSSLKTGDLSPLPVDAFAESPMESSIASGNLQPKLQRQCNSNPSGRHLSMRGRGSKGKILSAVRNSRDSPSSTRKRPAIDHTTANLATDASGYIPRGKAARVVGSVPQQKMLQQGDATYTTSLIQSMPIDAIERHLASLNNKMHITPQTISERCLPLVRKLIDDQFGWVFRDPVDPIALGLPDYFDVIKNPMHLYYVEAKLLKNEYQDIDSFSRDTRLVFNNAILYNGEDSEVGEMAAILLCLFDKDIKALLKDIGHDQRNLKHGDDSCILCGSYRRLFEPTTLYCNGACGMQWIRRNASYFTDHAKQNHWCASCYAGLQDNEPISLEDGSKIRKSDLQKLKNDGLPEEAWVQCDECNGWCHQICALFNGRKNKNTAKYRCPKCHIDKKRAGEPLGLQKEVTVAKDLPSCKMSTAIENGLRKALASAYEERALDIGVDVCEVQKADGLFVRVVSNLEKKHVVRDEMYSRYAKHGSASDFPVRSKCIALFQTIDGVDVILFAMYVYEYGDSCPNPNRRRVYISYLDSVFYFKPKYYRTIAYHALIIEYLRYVKERGFHTAHIWSCPPSNGDDYVFYCHPKEQLVPREDMLRQWYHRMLEKAKDEGIVLEILTLYDEYFANNGKDALSGISCNPTCLPYFEGDYIPGEIENIIKEIGDEEQLADISGGVAKTAQDAVMVALGEAMYNMRENFIVVRLRSNDFIAAVGKGEDVTDWIDIEGQTGVFSTKRIKIGSKDSSCLTKPSAVSKRIVVEKIEDIAVKSFAEGQPGAIDGTKNVSRAAVGAISNASTELPVLGYRIDQTTTRENPSVADDSYRQISEHDRVNLDVESKDGISGVNDGRTAKGESNISTAVDARERNIENASADATKLSENINAIEDEECTQSTEKSMTSSKRGLDEIEPSLPKHVKPVGSTNDEDGPQETEMFESRQQFLNYCQANHLQFDELRRAKHSTMMILFQLHNPSAPMFLQQCGACYRDITHGTRYHCRDCSSFDLCQDCYEPVTTGLWAKRDSRFTHNFQHTFVAIDMEAPEDLGKGTKERSRTIKLHLELLSHAATCGGPPICSLNNCRRMKKLFEHVESCEVTYRKGCKICSRLLSLLTIHARMCTVRGSCPLPFCDRIRERNKRRQQQQRLMDDRRRQAQNDLYRREAAS